jgi:hypothetical protein
MGADGREDAFSHSSYTVTCCLSNNSSIVVVVVVLIRCCGNVVWLPLLSNGYLFWLSCHSIEINFLMSGYTASTIITNSFLAYIPILKKGVGL